MNLFAKLSQLPSVGRPLRVGLIGACKFGSMYLAQLPRTPGAPGRHRRPVAVQERGRHLTKKGVVEVISSLKTDGSPVGYDIRKSVWVCIEAASDYIGIRHEPTGVPGHFNADVIATAKRDLKAGEMLDGECGYPRRPSSCCRTGRRSRTGSSARPPRATPAGARGR